MLYGLNSLLKYGKHKGKSISRVYCGDAPELILAFLNLMDYSFLEIFSKENYDVLSKPDVIDIAWLSSDWNNNKEGVN